MTAPRIGIAIPAYRAAGTLEATLRSCLAQTRTDWVAYVTVDGEDAVAERRIVAELADPRIHLEWNGCTLGQPGNFNRAVLRCHAAAVRWIKPLCADDVLRRDAIERMVAVGEESDRCGLVFGYYDGIDADGDRLYEVDLSRTPTRIEPGRAFFRKAIRLVNPIGGPSSVLIRADAIEHVGLFDERFVYAGDAVLWFRIVARYDVGIVGERAALDYRVHENSVTGRDHLSRARFNDPIDMLREIAARHPPGSEEWWLAHWTIGDVVATNLGTCASQALKGRFRSAAKGAADSLRRLSPFAVLSAAKTSLSIAARAVLSRKKPQEGPLDPPTRWISSNGRERRGRTT